jgi:hypothetical protein
LLVATVAGRSAIIGLISRAIDPRMGSIFGPMDPERAWMAMRSALVHASVVFAAGVALFRVAPRWPGVAGVVLLAVHSADLAAANRGLVMTVPETLFHARPELIRLIEQAEKANPTPGGHFRVHRIPSWEPMGWYRSAAPLRHHELVRWERRTIQPKYAIPYGVPYTLTEGVSELYDYMFFFSPFPGLYDNEALDRRFLGPNSTERIVAFPRRGFDMWNTRYFLLPYVAGNDEHRGIASFLPQTKLLAPAPVEGETDAQREARLEEWARVEDWQLLRNDAAYPRAWVVHEVKFWPPVAGMGRAEREPLMYEILYQNDPFWSVQGREVYDPRALAWIESGDGESPRGYVSHARSQASEAPRIVEYLPDRVVIEVELNSPGVVVLADVYYPGWTLTIDGRPAPIYRTNRMMRGAAVLSGRHRLVYRYEPDSFRHGAIGSAAALAALALLGLWSWRRPTDARIGAATVAAGDGSASEEALS